MLLNPLPLTILYAIVVMADFSSKIPAGPLPNSLFVDAAI